MMFPANFIIEIDFVVRLGDDERGLLPADLQVHEPDRRRRHRRRAWDKYQFFVFIATSMFINSIVQMFFMTNAEEFSELIRTGGLDFALLKPIDTQFLISLRKIEWSSLANFAGGGRAAGLRAAAGRRISTSPSGE